MAQSERGSKMGGGLVCSGHLGGFLEEAAPKLRAEG